MWNGNKKSLSSTGKQKPPSENARKKSISAWNGPLLSWCHRNAKVRFVFGCCLSLKQGVKMSHKSSHSVMMDILYSVPTFCVSAQPSDADQTWVLRLNNSHSVRVTRGRNHLVHFLCLLIMWQVSIYICTSLNTELSQWEWRWVLLKLQCH